LMLVPSPVGAPKSYIFADCALNTDPSADALADIAIASAASARRLLEDEPRIALLSFSTHGSANRARIDKIRAAHRAGAAQTSRPCHRRGAAGRRGDFAGCRRQEAQGPECGGG